MVFPRGQYWVWFLFISDLAEGTLSKVADLIQAFWEEGLIPLQAALPLGETWTGWRAGWRGTSSSSTKASVGSCPWGGTTPRTSTGWG